MGLMSRLEISLIPKEVISSWKEMKKGKFNPRDPGQYVALAMALYERGLVDKEYDWSRREVTSFGSVKNYYNRIPYYYNGLLEADYLTWGISDFVEEDKSISKLSVSPMTSFWVLSSGAEILNKNPENLQKKLEMRGRYISDNSPGYGVPSNSGFLPDLIPWKNKVMRYPQYPRYDQGLTFAMLGKTLEDYYNFIKGLKTFTFTIYGGGSWNYNKKYPNYEKDGEDYKFTDFTIHNEIQINSNRKLFKTYYDLSFFTSKAEFFVKKTKGHVKQRFTNFLNTYKSYNFAVSKDGYYIYRTTDYFSGDFHIPYVKAEVLASVSPEEAARDYINSTHPGTKPQNRPGGADFSVSDTHLIYFNIDEVIAGENAKASTIIDMDIECNPAYGIDGSQAYFAYKTNSVPGEYKIKPDKLLGDKINTESSILRRYYLPTDYNSMSGTAYKNGGCGLFTYSNEREFSYLTGYIRHTDVYTRVYVSPLYKDNESLAPYDWKVSVDEMTSKLNGYNNPMYTVNNHMHSLGFYMRALANGRTYTSGYSNIDAPYFYECKEITLDRNLAKSIKEIYTTLEWCIGDSWNAKKVKVPFSVSDDTLQFNFLALVKQEIPEFTGELNFGEGRKIVSKTLEKEATEIKSFNRVVGYAPAIYQIREIDKFTVNISELTVISESDGIFVFDTKE